jgi:17beta-estradiol 17-dehydrogenase / very-long-chain 3-oxoacyl-CoA reductase
VSTTIIPADFSIGRRVYERINNKLARLDVGILINNVARMYEFPNDFDEASEQLNWEIIDINIGAVTMMSRIVMSQMKCKRRGLIVNVSSFCEAQPMPLAAVYGATKSYMRSFTLGTYTCYGEVIKMRKLNSIFYVALSRELAVYDVKVHLVSPMFVRTELISFDTQLRSVFAPSAEAYVKAAIKTLGKCSRTTGYWVHGFQVCY